MQSSTPQQDAATEAWTADLIVFVQALYYWATLPPWVGIWVIRYIVSSTGVLDEGDDELMNVNVHDVERAEKNLDRKKKKPTYNPYDMEEDEYGTVCIL